VDQFHGAQVDQFQTARIMLVWSPFGHQQGDVFGGLMTG